MKRNHKSRTEACWQKRKVIHFKTQIKEPWLYLTNFSTVHHTEWEEEENSDKTEIQRMIGEEIYKSEMNQ